MLFVALLLFLQAALSLSAQSKFQSDGPCRLWWPLNDTAVAVLPSAQQQPAASDEVVLVCSEPGQATEAPDDLSFEQLVSLRDDGSGQVRPQRRQLTVSVTFEFEEEGEGGTGAGGGRVTRGAPMLFPLGPAATTSGVPIVLKHSVPVPRNGPAGQLRQSIRVLRGVAGQGGGEGDVLSEFPALLRRVDDWAEATAAAAAEQAPGGVGPLNPNCGLDHPLLRALRSRDDLGAWLPLLLPRQAAAGPLVIAEVGVLRGAYSLGTLLPACGAACGKWLLVDPWERLYPLDAEGAYVDAANAGPALAQAHREEVERLAAIARAQWPGLQVTLLQDTSVAAAARLRNAAAADNDDDDGTSDDDGVRAPHQLHFVYLDAAHDYGSVVGDLCAWFPLLAPGGLLGGHDYVRSRYLHRTLFTVRQAVDAFAFALWLPLHVVGDAEEGFPSWLLHRPERLSARQQAALASFCKGESEGEG